MTCGVSTFKYVIFNNYLSVWSRSWKYSHECCLLEFYTL